MNSDLVDQKLFAKVHNRSDTLWKFVNFWKKYTFGQGQIKADLVGVVLFLGLFSWFWVNLEFLGLPQKLIKTQWIKTRGKWYISKNINFNQKAPPPPRYLLFNGWPEMAFMVSFKWPFGRSGNRVHKFTERPVRVLIPPSFWAKHSPHIL